MNIKLIGGIAVLAIGGYFVYKYFTGKDEEELPAPSYGGGGGSDILYEILAERQAGTNDLLQQLLNLFTQESAPDVTTEPTEPPVLPMGAIPPSEWQIPYFPKTFELGEGLSLTFPEIGAGMKEVRYPSEYWGETRVIGIGTGLPAAETPIAFQEVPTGYRAPRAGETAGLHLIGEMAAGEKAELPEPQAGIGRALFMPAGILSFGLVGDIPDFVPFIGGEGLVSTGRILSGAYEAGRQFGRGLGRGSFVKTIAETVTRPAGIRGAGTFTPMRRTSTVPLRKGFTRMKTPTITPKTMADVAITAITSVMTGGLV